MVILNYLDDMIVIIYVCRGNYYLIFVVLGGYELIVEILFVKENVDGFYFEFDIDRVGDFLLFCFLGDGK